MEPADRRIIREKLAELLGEPLERLVGATRLRAFARYDYKLARELLQTLGLVLPEDQLRRFERVQDLVDALALRPRAQPGGEASGPAAARPAAAQPKAAPVPPAPKGSYESSDPYDESRIHAAAMYCSDGRIGEHVDEFLQTGLGLPRYDRLACPGGPVALAGRLRAMWEARGVDEQLGFLIRTHGLETVVLIAHEGCAYYRERLGLGSAQLEPEQRKDLDLAAWAAHRMQPSLRVQAFFARTVGARVRFEPLALALPAPRSRAEPGLRAP